MARWDALKRFLTQEFTEGGFPRYLFHQSAAPVSKLKAEGLRPRFGDFTLNAYGIPDEELKELLARSDPAVFFKDQPDRLGGYIAMQLSQGSRPKIGEPWSKIVSPDDIAKRGSVSVLDLFENPRENIYRMSPRDPEGVIEWPNVFSDVSKRESGLTWEAIKSRSGMKENPFVEPGDYFTPDEVDPDQIIHGKSLLRFLENSAADNPIIAEILQGIKGRGKS